jgi:hypothetical protein
MVSLEVSGLGLILRREEIFIFSTTSRPSLRPTQAPFQLAYAALTKGEIRTDPVRGEERVQV